MSADPFDSLMASLDPRWSWSPRPRATSAGCLVGFHSQTSIGPERYCVWLSKANHTYRVALLASHLGIHLLTDGDRDLAELFGTVSGDEVDKFALVEAEVGAEGVPVLAACPHRLVARKRVVLDEGGDHVCVVTEPVESRPPGRSRPSGCRRSRTWTPGTTPPTVPAHRPSGPPTAEPVRRRPRRRRRRRPAWPRDSPTCRWASVA